MKIIRFPIHFSSFVLALFILSYSIAAHAERVRPKSDVVTGVNVRAEAAGGSASLRLLRPGEHLPYDGSVPRWHRVRLEDGRPGFVSKRWTEVIPDPVTSTATQFAIHFLDVGTGDSAIIDMGDREIIIDGGDSIRVLNAYAERIGIIDGPIELVVVTHGDTDHWKGLRRLLGFDGVVDNPRAVQEFWDAGYNRDCNPANNGGRRNYLQFISDVRGSVVPARFRRPLEAHHVPADVSGTPQPFTLPSLPGVTFTLLHSDANPTTGSCSYKINNASIVLMIEIDSVRFLFTGDANGKERDEGSPGTPGHVEQRLLALEEAHNGTLKAHVLKAPHHGSETASTQSFINAVDPQFIIVSASTKHHLPRSTVISRYENGTRVILRTDENRENDRDHVICMKVDDQLTCNFADVFAQ